MYSDIRSGERKAKSGKYREFMEAIKKAEHEAEVRMVAMWQKHMPENWQAIATFLERRYPDRWGRKRLDIEHSGEIGIKIVDDIDVED